MVACLDRDWTPSPLPLVTEVCVPMNVPESRAATKLPKSADDRLFVHAVLLNDPVKRIYNDTLRRLRFQHGPEEFHYLGAPEAICGRHVRVVYPMPFKPDEEDDACPECKQLLSILRVDPEQYPPQARRIKQQVRERERELHEKRQRAAEERGKAQHAVRRLFDAEPDDADEEEPSPDLMELLRRADRDDPDAALPPTSP